MRTRVAQADLVVEADAGVEADLCGAPAAHACAAGCKIRLPYDLSF
jgi:hypothetical protein